VSAEFWITQAFNGLSYGALLFLLASGLSLIFGVMRIVNMAHGSYFMLGGYVGLSVVWRTGSFTAALLAGALALALVGVGMERFFLRRLPGQTLGQALMTIGFALTHVTGIKRNAATKKRRLPSRPRPAADWRPPLLDRCSAFMLA